MFSGDWFTAGRNRDQSAEPYKVGETYRARLTNRLTKMFRAGANLSGKVTDSTQEHYLELPSIEEDSHENSELVTTCPENEESCRARTRTYRV